MKNGFRNWSDVRIFLSVVREGSTLAASRKLNIAQPTVARRVEALEHELGLTLFERDSRGFRPTKGAKSLLTLAEAMEIAACNLSEKAIELSRPRPIRITAFSANFSARAADIFSEFSAIHPDVRFEFLPGVKVLDLAAGEADIALRIVREEPDQDLISRRISTARFTVYGAQIYADQYGLPSTPDDMQGHSFVTFENDEVPATLHNWLTRHVSPDQIVQSFSEIGLMHAAIRAGRGLGVMNVRMAGDDEKLIPCFDPPEELSAQHLMLVAPEAYRRPEVKEFTKFFAPRYAKLYK